MAVGYCVTDVAYEAYKLQKRGGVTEHGVPMSITQVRYNVEENGRDGEWEGGREGGQKEGRNEGREGGREEGRKEAILIISIYSHFISHTFSACSPFIALISTTFFSYII